MTCSYGLIDCLLEVFHFYWPDMRTFRPPKGLRSMPASDQSAEFGCKSIDLRLRVLLFFVKPSRVYVMLPIPVRLVSVPLCLMAKLTHLLIPLSALWLCLASSYGNDQAQYLARGTIPFFSAASSRTALHCTVPVQSCLTSVSVLPQSQAAPAYSHSDTVCHCALAPICIDC